MAGRPILHGELAVRAVLRAGGVLYFGTTPESSIEVTSEQALEALAKDLDRLVWTLGPSATERPVPESLPAPVRLVKTSR